MSKIFALSTALTVALGTAAYAGQPPSAAAAPYSSAPSTSLALNSQGAMTSTVPVFSAAAPAAPGFTGRTVVRGNNSTIGGDAEATRMQQTGMVGGR